MTGCRREVLSICLGIEACNQEISVKFFRTEFLVSQLLESKSSDTLTMLLKRLNKAYIFTLDELGYVTYDCIGSRQS